MSDQIPTSSPPQQLKKVALLPPMPLPSSLQWCHSYAEQTLPEVAPQGLWIKVQLEEMPHQCCEGWAEC